MEIANLQKLRKIYDELTFLGQTLPKNTGRDFYKRNLDCFLINYFVAQEKSQGNEYDSVRGVFFEGDELYKMLVSVRKSYSNLCNQSQLHNSLFQSKKN